MAGDSDVTVHLSAFDEILALHGSLRIPYTHIASVSADAVPFEWYRGIKIGTDVPGVKVAGTFITGEGSIFQCVQARPAAIHGSGDTTGTGA